MNWKIIACKIMELQKSAKNKLHEIKWPSKYFWQSWRVCISALRISEVAAAKVRALLNELLCSSDNLVEGKRRRRGTPGGPNTPNRSSSSSPRTPGPSVKRKLSSEEGRTPSKRGRRGGGARAGTGIRPPGPWLNLGGAVGRGGIYCAWI